MTLIMNHAPQRLSRSLLLRLQGPGGYYNIGNALGLAVGIGIQIHLAGSGSLGGYLAGSASSTLLTVATLIFFWSGELYHRAWNVPGPYDMPDLALNRRGDFLSGVGALLLGGALWLLGEPMLAAFSGLLHAFGKFGSAWHGDHTFSLPITGEDGPDPFRSLVLASRIPAMLAAVIALAQPASLTGTESVSLLALLASYLLWCRADLMLMRG